MTYTHRRRLPFSRLVGTVSAVSFAVTGIVLGAGVGAAGAAPTEQFSISTGFDRTVPVRSTGGGADYRPLSVVFYDQTGNPLRGVKVGVDGSQLSGFAELDLPKGCTYTSTDHLHESCAVGDTVGGGGEFSVGVRALAAATEGQSGRVSFTVTAANGTGEQTGLDGVGVTVGDGPDLAVNDLGASVKVTPGGTTALPLQLTNVGSREGKGIVVFVHDQYQHSEVLGNYSNCLYEHYQDGQRGAYCTFPDTVIAPGQRLRLSDPFTVSTPAGAHGDEVQYGAGLAGDDWVGIPEGTPGTGGKLTLEPVPAAASGKAFSPSVDIDTYNNLYYTRLDTGTVTDVEGVADTVDAVIGHPTAVTFSVRNSGTTTLSGRDENLNGTIGAYLELPATMEVIQVPKECKVALGSPVAVVPYPEAKKPTMYFCVRTVTLAPGEAAGFTFEAVARKAVSGQYATMYAIAREDPTAGDRNNYAHIAINATTAAATSTPTATGAANAPSADGDQGGELAATGSGSAPRWAAIGGGVLLAAGTAALIGARRRRPARRG